MLELRLKKPADFGKRLKVILDGNFHAFMNIAGQTLVSDITGNILQQRAVDGAKLKENKDKTKTYKLKYLGHSASLIWHRVLIDKSTYIIKSSKNKVQVSIAKIRKAIALGYTNKSLVKKGYNFWGISPWVKEVILKKWHDYIKNGLN